MSASPYRLPRTVVPIRYEIQLEPDLDRAIFTGSETITVEVNTPVKEIVINASELEINHAVLSNPAASIAGTATLDSESQRATITLAEEAAAGTWTLHLEFTGILNDQLVGFYRSTFTDVDGVSQAIATTQFEATDARRAFPCWDEPDLKAVFSVTLVVPEHLLAISNTAEAGRCPAGEGKVAIQFADTIKMSTYLVAFVVGPFEATDPVEVDGTPVRIIAPRGKLHLSDYALECAVFCLRYLGGYYGIPYPGDKVDHVAIPDFAFGAMENLGCITYRETALLLDPETASQQERLRVLDVIGHELAHMWFGDLVTMKWWDGIWLNEAFASFMEMKATDARRPDWKRWLAFGAVERPWAFGVDALDSTRPVEFEVNSPTEANEMFDALTYGKGSSLLRMLEQYIGEEEFRQGVGDYLRQHAYANTVTADLWRGLNGASGAPVGEIMDTWILQRGYPQIDVGPSDGGIRLRQRRFFTIPDDTDQTSWQVPIQLRGTAGDLSFQRKLLLTEPETMIPFDQPIQWVVGNAGGHGFYRVRYQTEIFDDLIGRLHELDDLERYTLVDDTWAFVESGQLGAPHYLDLIKAYRNEQEQAIWQAVLGGLGALSHHLVEDQARPAFQQLVADTVQPIFTRLGWEPQAGDDDLTRRLRGLVVGALGRLAEDEELVARCREIAAIAVREARGLDPELARAALFVTAATGNESHYELILGGYRNANTPQEELRFLQALTQFDAERLTVRTVEHTMDGTIRNQDGAWVLAACFGNRRHGPDAWTAVRRRWDEVNKFPPITLRRLVEGLPALSRPDVSADVHAFFAETPMLPAAKALAQNLERLRANVALRERETASVSEYLKVEAVDG